MTDVFPDPTTPADDDVRDAPGTSRTDAGAVADGNVADGNVADASVASADVDLDAIERDLAAVETALGRLSDGTYWTDEVTGEPIPDHVLAADPTARRA